MIQYVFVTLMERNVLTYGYKGNSGICERYGI
jgi:hypothetical protein